MAGLPPFPWATTLRKTEELLAFCQKTAEFLRGIGKIKQLDGQWLDVDFDAVSNVVVRHSLGRPYNGAQVYATTNSTGTPGVTAFSAHAFASLGGDPVNFIALGGHTVFTARLTVWVF